MPDIFGRIPLRFIIDVLASFHSFFSVGTAGSWQDVSMTNFTDVRQGSSPSGTFRTVRPVFNSTDGGTDGVLEQDSPEDIKPRLTRDDFNMLYMSTYIESRGDWGVVENWGQTAHSNASGVSPTLRIASADGTNERTGSDEIQSGDVIQILVPSGITTSPGPSETLPDGALRIIMQINQD